MRNHAKLFIILIFLTLSFAFSCQRATEPGKALSSSNPSGTQIYKTRGVVKAIDADAGKVTVAHEEIQGFMPAMEAAMAVADAKMLELVKVGDRIEFELERSPARLVITKMTKTVETAVVNGGEVYKMNCAECHGDLGEGAPKGISLLKGHALKHSEDEYVEQVTGGEGKKMPAFKDKLSAEQIAAVVKFVREELQKDVPKEESADHKH